MYISIYLSTTIYLSNYRTSYRLFFIPWYEFAIPCLHLDWRLKIPQKLFPQIFNPPNLRGDWRSEEEILWNLQSEEEKASIRLPIPFHSISVRPSYPSTHIVHPSILSVHLHSYLFTYLPIYLYISTNLSSYLSFDPSIYLIIYFHTTLQSLGCMWIEDPRKNNLQSKEGYRGYRQQEALRSRSHDMRVSPYSNNSNRL